MGCGSSQSASTSSLDSSSDKAKQEISSASLRKQVLIGQNEAPRPSDGRSSSENDAQERRAESRNSCNDSGIDSAKTMDRRRGLRESSLQSTERSDQVEEVNDERQTAVPTPVAFEVVLGESKGQSIVKQHPPKRLQMTIDSNHPRVTAEMLAERQRVADERRLEELRKRGKSAKRTSRRRKELLAAREFGDNQLAEAHLKKLEDKSHSAEKNRARNNAELHSKHKLRELRAVQARDKARRLNQMADEDDDDDFEMERDELFNADDDADSWLNGANNTHLPPKGSASPNDSERIYNGRSSPTKRFVRLSSAEVRRKRQSLGSDIDSDDDAMAVGNQWASHAPNRSTKTGTRDRFFDT